ncbi:MAG: MarR family transcriptional regulator [Deltaproteobacteria bacterium]|nr:MarR family transcriptional regulator [Deltaproteobacteria bacterium]
MNPNELRDQIRLIIHAYELYETSLDRVIQTWIRKYGKKDVIGKLRFSQAQALLAIWRIEPCNLSRVARVFKITKGAASQMIQRLIDSGVVIRRQNPENHREVIIEIKSETRTFFKEVDGEILRWMEELSMKLGPETMAQWYEVMGKLRDILQTEWEDGK